MQKENNKGITLTALIITIIVMLILASVVIWQVVADDGLIRKVLSAVDKRNEAIEQESQDLATLENKVDEYLGGGAVVPQVDSSTGLATAKFTKEFTEDLKITIPEGFGIAQLDNSEFKRVTGVLPADQWDAYLTQENVDDNGVVVVDAAGNEFVWVPVEAGSIWWDNNGQKVGQLWATTYGESFGTKNTTYTANSELREPDVVTNYDGNTTYLKTALGVSTDDELKLALSLDDLSNTTANANAFKAILQNEFNQMTTSVDNYGGFYVGRYETGGFNTSQCIVKAGEGDNSINRVNWYTMYNKTKTLSSTSVASTLIWGCQYDAMCNWLTSTSRTKQSDDTRTSSSTLNTGAIASDVDKNIYDLAGNVLEWTMGACVTNGRVYRGGDCYDAYSVSYRYDYAPLNSDNFLGGRSALFIL